MRIYISGELSGTRECLSRFARREAALKAWGEGITVMNPAKTCGTLPEDTSEEEYLRVRLTLLELCDVLYLMRGWEESEGARLENAVALCKNMPIIKETVS